MAEDIGKTNGIDPTVTNRFISEIERHHETLATYQGEYMNRCRGVRELISKAKDRAKDAGIPLKALNAELKDRADLNRIAKRRGKLEEDDLKHLDDIRRVTDTADRMKEALGDFAATPLGAAAVSNVEKIGTAKSRSKPN